MTTKSDRNLSYIEAVHAGLVSDLSTISTVANTPDYGPDGVYVDPKLHQTLKMKTEAVKADDGKVDWSLVPFEALEGMAQVLTFGAKKYDSWNWTTGGGFVWTRVLASCFRHLFAWSRGEDNDPESGLSHISHAQCNLLFLAYYIRNKDKFNKDNRNVR